MNTYLLLNYALAIVALMLSGLLWQSRTELDNITAQQRESTKHHRQMVGFTRLWPGSNGEPLSYNLRSFDGGSTWVEVEYDKDWKMTIKGDPEVLHPGLLSSVLGMEALAQKARTSGALDPSNPRDRLLLERAGFGVSVQQ